MMIAGYTATQVVLMFNFVLDAVIGLSAVFGASAGMNAVPRKMTRLVSGESHRHTHTCTHTVVTLPLIADDNRAAVAACTLLQTTTTK